MEKENLKVLSQEIQELEIRKWEVRIGKAHLFGIVTLAAGGSAAVLGSIPSIYYDLLPRWADISLATGGLLTGPGSILAISDTKKMLADAKRGLEVQREKVQSLSEFDDT